MVLYGILLCTVLLLCNDAVYSAVLFNVTFCNGTMVLHAIVLYASLLCTTLFICNVAACKICKKYYDIQCQKYRDNGAKTLVISEWGSHKP